MWCRGRSVDPLPGRGHRMLAAYPNREVSISIHEDVTKERIQKFLGDKPVRVAVENTGTVASLATRSGVTLGTQPGYEERCDPGDPAGTVWPGFGIPISLLCLGAEQSRLLEPAQLTVCLPGQPDPGSLSALLLELQDSISSREVKQGAIARSRVWECSRGECWRPRDRHPYLTKGHSSGPLEKAHHNDTNAMRTQTRL
ncbi:hypothetical protein llap_15262 [Limosa lapponica baueri]|uniref:Uncharacterized protein n=1 Tax=Limosa lapponica baueri TaxID=1758121 RepID=A0A2I0TKT4_LIMLA|nr:hypothetical protein llap_15262 [Limosa lapponica baueri]